MNNEANQVSRSTLHDETIETLQQPAAADAAAPAIADGTLSPSSAGNTPRAGESGDWSDPNDPILYTTSPTGRPSDGLHDKEEAADDHGASQDEQAPTAPEIAALCETARAMGEPWEPLLADNAHGDASLETRVLDLLGNRKGWPKRTALEKRYGRFVMGQTSRQSEDCCDALAGDSGKAILQYDPADLNKALDDTEAALRNVPGRWPVLIHGGVHSYVASEPPRYLHHFGDMEAEAPGIPCLKPYTKESMKLRIDQSVAVRVKGKNGWERGEVPNKLVASILKNPSPNLPTTVGLVTHPVLLPDGELLIQEGLHPGSRLYLDFQGTRFQAQDGMTAEQGLRILREEMLGEFELATLADEAAALAFILTGIQRKTMDIAPGFMVNASTQGSGKSTLARMVNLLLTGHEMPVATITENADEQAKAITAMLLQSAPLVCFDNVLDGSVVESPTLAKVITSPVHTGRILGHSKMAELPTNTVIVLTGNNIATSLDLSRRFLEIRLAPRSERPEQRRFEHPDVVEYVVGNRVRWMQAALAVLQFSRTPSAGALPSGFQQWDMAVRWPLVNLGTEDPARKFDDVRTNSPDLQWMTAWMLGLEQGFGAGASFRAQDLVKQGGQKANAVSQAPFSEMAQREAMYADYLDGHPPRKGWASVNAVGIMLGRLVNRSIEGYTLNKKTVHGTSHYTVEPQQRQT